MRDLSILIPSRNEMFLKRTVEDVLSNIEGDTEIIVVLDGKWSDPPLIQHDRVKVIYNNKSVGQRAATNQAVKLSNAKYIMKVDAHCAFDKGFDVKMMQDMQDDWTMVPTMRNLHAFDWVCEDGHRRYQGPSGPCTVCNKETTRDVIWYPKPSPQSNSFRFDTDMHFQYWNEWGKAQQGKLTETMSIQGSCFMLTREKYLELDICSEEFHSWGQQGVEVACKTWLSGGKVIVNRNTWYAHMFRTQGGDFSFPYENPQSKVNDNRNLSKKMFRDNKWPKAKYKFEWLINKFNPPGWKTEPSKGIIFYTDNQLKIKIAHAVQKRLRSIGLPIVSASLKPMNFGQNIVINEPRGYKAYFTQILSALEASTTDIIFFCEHDVIYDKSHFEFVPPTKDNFYYNINVVKVDYETGRTLKVNDCKQVSGLCAYRSLLLDEYRKRLAVVERDGYTRSTGFEAGTHDNRADSWISPQPNYDIRHDKNLTKNRWSKEQFRNQKHTEGWTEGLMDVKELI